MRRLIQLWNRYHRCMPLASDKRKRVRLVIIQLLPALPRVMDCPTTPALQPDDDNKRFNSSISDPTFNLHEQLSGVPTPRSVLASQVKEPRAEGAALVVLLHLL